ncbi:Uu.00g096230.m01.CDS01 [Anthostomella pinea]|uniref:Uu.00g096230.m01.CDS01 n=1 Tax=Anthostomella pinea TaxID=933095 RepID=A0AAI8YCI3_9PEZI|nr:Uu.00g096230.m01.CDS01 [Anthostomella pinea]
MALNPAVGTLAPLPPILLHGSIVIAIFAFLSFFASLALFIYLTVKIVSWQLSRKHHVADTATGQGFSMDVQDFTPCAACKSFHLSTKTRQLPPRRKLPNQFLVLIFNLLLADLHQATAFLLSSSWAAQNDIMVGTSTCFVQGLFICTGDLASSCFMSAIAIHTYFSIVKGYRPSHRVLYACMIGIWVFDYAMALLPVAATHNGAANGGYFVRAAAWCWISREYELLRLLTHYLFIFISIVVATTFYALIVLFLRRQHQRGGLENVKDKHHPAFLAYPLIYLVCILPLALGRIATMAGSEPPVGYFCFAGALTASNGWLDVVLFATTRRAIVFATGNDLANEDTGLDTFAFMRTPATGFGNMVWVRGGRAEHERERERADHGGWWRIRGDSQAGARHVGGNLGTTSSQTSLTPQGGNTIQMEVVTSVLVESDGSGERSMADSRALSINSMDKDQYSRRN